jgi:D123
VVAYRSRESTRYSVIVARRLRAVLPRKVGPNLFFDTLAKSHVIHPEPPRHFEAQTAMNIVESLVAEAAEPLTSTREQSLGPFATCQQVKECQFSSWYPIFSSLEGEERTNVTIKAVILRDLPKDLEDYFLSDGASPPIGAEKLSACGHGNDRWSSDEEEEMDEQNGTQESEFSFPTLNLRLAEAIRTLKGAVVPKLNWSVPKDAAWVNGGSLKCEAPGDIYVLVKSSDFCLHDVLLKAWKECQDYDPSVPHPQLELILRKWCNLNPSMEFRCFVRQDELIAISQRDHTQHYAHLLQHKTRIQELLSEFFEDIVRNRFGNGSVHNYVIDVYLDQKHRVWLIDFNIWARSTDSLLFEWSELLTVDAEDEPVFRLVETANQVRQDPLASYRAPIDTLHLASLTGGTSKKFDDLMKQCVRPSEVDDEEM